MTATTTTLLTVEYFKKTYASTFKDVSDEKIKDVLERLKNDWITTTDELKVVTRDTLQKNNYPGLFVDAVKPPPRMDRVIKEIPFGSRFETGSFQSMLNELRKFYMREGHCNAPIYHKENGKNLGYWVRKQRELRKQGKLDASCQKQLDELGFVWDIHDMQWREMYNLLIRYKNRVGNCNVPRDHEENGKKLSIWMDHQRQLKKQRKLDIFRQEQLDKLDFVWDSHDMQWREMYDLLIQYKSRVGNFNIPQDYKENGKRLGSWVNKQRIFKNKGKLDTSRQEQLDKLGFVWDPNDMQWRKMYHLLIQYKSRVGNFNVPIDYEENEIKLGNWVNRQRFLKKNGELDAFRQEQLDKLGFVWNSHDMQWREMYDLLIQYNNRVGNCNVPKNHEENGKKLGKWVDTQRALKGKVKLNASRQEQLDILGFVWEQWCDMYALLNQYKSRVGNCNVPRDYEENGKRLGNWVDTQRSLKKKGKLDSVCEDLLRKLGVEFREE